MLGVFLFDLNRLEDAASELRQAIALDAGYANALCNLGSALHRLEKDGKAENACRRALEADPNNKPARTGLAATLQESRKRGVTVSKINITRIDRHLASQVSKSTLYATGLP